MEETYLTKRIVVPEAEELLGKEFKCLNDGFVRLVDYMGGDSSIVQAARVSYGKGTKKISEDQGLIRYLMRHRHTTPFEMVELKFHVRAPMDCWRQWIRHRTANVNEYSTRYSIAIDESQKTLSNEWRLQSGSNKQGSSDYLDEAIGSILSEKELELQKLSREVYEERIEKGVAREQARKDLPLSTYTEAYWKIDLHNLFHFLGLRMDSHAQEEIRKYATIMGEEITSKVTPIAYKAFKDYVLGGMRLSSLEIKLLGDITSRRLNPQEAVESIKNKRERTELSKKLEILIK